MFWFVFKVRNEILCGEIEAESGKMTVWCVYICIRVHCGSARVIDVAAILPVAAGFPLCAR